MQLQAALHRTGGHYASAAAGTTRGPASVPSPPSKQLLRAKPPAVLRLLTTQVIISTTSLHLRGPEGRPLLERDCFRRWSLGERFQKKVEERAPLRIRAAGSTAAGKAGNSGAPSRGLAPVTACMTLAGCLLFSGPQLPPGQEWPRMRKPLSW